MTEVGRLSGLFAPGAEGVSTVPLRTGEVWAIGRRDPAFLRSCPERAARHLGVPDARPDLSVTALQLRVGTVAVAVASTRGEGVLVDGAIRPSPAVLTEGTSHVNPSPAGLHLDFAVTVLVGDRFTDDAPAATSGTTVRLRIELEPHSALWRTAHASAWPLMSTVRRPHAQGWSGPEVAARLAQLGWAGGTRATTVLSQQLHTLAERVAQCRLTDGRPAAAVMPQWPPWEPDTAGETRDERAERRNRCVAEALWRAGAVEVAAIDRA